MHFFCCTLSSSFLGGQTSGLLELKTTPGASVPADCRWGSPRPQARRQYFRMLCTAASLGAVFFFIPVVGEVAGSVFESDAITAITALRATGNAAQDIYTLVDIPENAPVEIFGLMLEPLALSNLASVSRAAKARRGMSGNDVVKLVVAVVKGMRGVKKVIGT